MIENNFVKFGLCFMLLLLAVLMWVVFKSPIAFISGSVGLLFLIRFIYEYKTQRKDRYITLFGMGLIGLLQAVLFWIYNPYISFIFGLLVFIFLIKVLNEYKNSKDNLNKVELI